MAFAIDAATFAVAEALIVPLQVPAPASGEVAADAGPKSTGVFRGVRLVFAKPVLRAWW